MTYINLKSEYGIETVDEFETYKEARAMVVEYNLGHGGHYLSQRSTKEWRDR